MHRVRNTGSMLQAYATQKLVEGLGFDAELIDYHYPNDLHRRVTGRFDLMKQIGRSVKRSIFRKQTLQFEKNFDDFLKGRLNLSKAYPTARSLSEDPPACDVYLAGSDQIWNTAFIGEDTSFLLDFGAENVPRISFASSLGGTTLIEERQEDFRRCLSRFKHLGVRESAGVEIVSRLAGKNASLNLDPTLMLSSADWDQVAVQPNIGEPYILCYGYDPAETTIRMARWIRSKTGLQIVALHGQPHRRLINRDVKYIPDAGPAEFVGLFKNAAFTVPKSLHGTIFSIIYSKPFYSIHRGVDAANDNRQVSLLRLLDLAERGVAESDSTPVDVSLEVDFERAHRILSSEREKSINYLSQALQSNRS